MSRPTIPIPTDDVVASLKKGEHPEALAKRHKVSARTAKTWRSKVLKGELKKERASAPFEVLPEPPEEVPSGTPLEKIDYWLDVAERKAKTAELDGDFDTLIKMARLAAVYLEAKRKATPKPKADPNESPDLIAAAVRVRERWHTLIKNLAEKRGVPG